MTTRKSEYQRFAATSDMVPVIHDSIVRALVERLTPEADDGVRTIQADALAVAAQNAAASERGRAIGNCRAGVGSPASPKRALASLYPAVARTAACRLPSSAACGAIALT